MVLEPEKQPPPVKLGRRQHSDDESDCSEVVSSNASR